MTPNSGEIYIIGAGGHGAVVAEIAMVLGYKIVGFVDDDPKLHGTTILDWKVLGYSDLIPERATVGLGIGNNQIRSNLLDRAKSLLWELPILVHPSAVVSPSAAIGKGTVIMAQAVVNARAKIGEGCILNTACSVDHDCVLGEAVHICPGTRLAGVVTIGSQTMMGIASCTRQCVRIGERCTVGAGSVVVSEIPDDSTAYGNPARIVQAKK